MNKWTEIVDLINRSDDIVIMTHTNKDGDAIGSASALCHALRHIGKRCVILLEDDIPGYLKFMHDHSGKDKGEEPFFVYSVPFVPGLSIVVDCGDMGRIEKRVDVYKKSAAKICIDHHVQTEGFADLSVIEPTASATGILVYQLIKELGVPVDKEIAEDIFVAIMTDTGCFRYSNTTAECHLITAELYKAGIEFSKLGTLIYDTLPLSQVKLEAMIIDWMEIFAEGRAVISYITNDRLKEIGATYDMTSNCIDVIRKIDTVEICAFLKEHDDGSIKLSFRAKSYANVLNIALALGGGGHVKASGGTLHCSMEEALALVKAEMIKELARCDHEGLS